MSEEWKWRTESTRRQQKSTKQGREEGVTTLIVRKQKGEKVDEIAKTISKILEVCQILDASYLFLLDNFIDESTYFID